MTQEPTLIGVPDLDDLLYNYWLNRSAQHAYVQKSQHVPGSDDDVYMHLVDTTEYFRAAIHARVEQLVAEERDACEAIVRQLCDEIMEREGLGRTLDLACKARFSIAARTQSPETTA